MNISFRVKNNSGSEGKNNLLLHEHIVSCENNSHSEGKNILLLLYMNISLFFTYMLFVNFEGKKLHIDLETQECQSEQEISPDITR